MGATLLQVRMKDTYRRVQQPGATGPALHRRMVCSGHAPYPLMNKPDHTPSSLNTIILFSINESEWEMRVRGRGCRRIRTHPEAGRCEKDVRCKGGLHRLWK